MPSADPAPDPAAERRAAHTTRWLVIGFAIVEAIVIGIALAAEFARRAS